MGLRRWLALAAAGAVVVTGTGCLHEVAPTGPGAGPYARVVVNNGGVIAGSTTAGLTTPGHAFVQRPDGPMQLLDDRGFGISTVAAINDRDEVVGTLGETRAGEQNQASYAFWWTPQTGLQQLDLPPGTVGARALDVNAGGTILVEGYPNYWAEASQPFLYDSRLRSWTPLPLPSGPGSGSGWAAALNDQGEVVGNAVLRAGEAQQAVYWDAAHQIHELDDGGAAVSQATDLNESGAIVGAIGSQVAYWSSLAAAPRLFPGMAPRSVNKRGWFVGARQLGPEQGSRKVATLWDPAAGTVVDLGDYGSGSSQAEDINDQGVAVGMAWKGLGQPDAPQVVRWDAYTG